MVKRFDRWGNAYHEPPYTDAEQDELYKRMSTVVAFTRPQATGQATPAPENHTKDDAMKSGVSNDE